MKYLRRLTRHERAEIDRRLSRLEVIASNMDRKSLDTWEGWSLLSQIDSLRWELKLDALRKSLFRIPA